MIFDGQNRRIILEETTTSSSEIWSNWVRWLDLDTTNTKWLPALKQVGGDDLGSGLLIPPYIFLLNGWRIRPKEANHLLVISGNIFVDGGGQPVVNTLGAYNVSIQYTVPVQAQGYSTTSTGGTSITADEIWNYTSRSLTASTTSSLTQEQNDKLMSLDTSNIQVDPQDIWSYTNRTLTQAVVGDVDLSGIPAAVWSYISRTLTVSAGLTPEQETKLNDILTKVNETVSVDPAQIWGYNIRTLTSSTAGVTPELEAKIDAIKAKTDKFMFDISNRILSYLDDKSGFSLTELERTNISNAVQNAIISESDGTQILKAITDKISALNPTLGELTLSAIASSVWNNTQRTLTQITGLTSEQASKLQSLPSDIWTYNTRGLTDKDVNVKYINNELVSSIEDFKTDISGIGYDVWNHNIRTITQDTGLTIAQENTINNIVSGVWEYSDRRLSSDSVNITKVNGVPVSSINDFRVDISGIPASVWSYGTRNISNPNTLTAASIWSYLNRSLTNIDMNITKVNGTTVSSITDFKTDLSSIPGSIWNYVNRTTTDAKLSVASIWDYASRTLTENDSNIQYVNGLPISGISDFHNNITDISNAVWNRVTRTLTTEISLSPETEAKIDAIKAKTDLLKFNGNYILSQIDNKTGFSLTVDEKILIANMIEQEIINDTDSEKVLEAITNKIASVNPSLGELSLSSIASSVWNQPTRTLTASSGLSVSQEAKLDAIPGNVWGYGSRSTTDSNEKASAVWNFGNRSLTDTDVNVVSVSNEAVTLNDFKTDISGIANSVWSYVTRSTTESKLRASDVWSYADRTLTEVVGLTSEQEDKINAIKSKTDKLSFDISNNLASYLTDKTGFTLTTDERDQIAEAVEQAILDEADGETVLTAISNQILNINPDFNRLTLRNIAINVWDYTTRTLSSEIGLTSEQEAKINNIMTKLNGTIDANITKVNGNTVSSTDDFKADVSNIGSITPQDIWEYTNRTITESAMSLEEHNKLMSIDTLILKKILINTKEIKNNQLTIYDDDGITVLFRWNLKNKDGSPSELAIYKTEKV